MTTGVGDTWNALGQGEVAVAVGIAAASFLGTILVTGVAILRIPENYFVTDKRALPLPGRSPMARIAAQVARNLAGLGLIVVGVLLSLPGVPGQGLLTILLGIMLTDLPGKRRFERALVRRRLIHRPIQKLRVRFGRAPILLPE